MLLALPVGAAVAALVGLLVAVFAISLRVVQPGLRAFCADYALPRNFAALTVLTMGAQMPEIALTTVGSLDVGVAVVFGTAVINFTLLPALCCLASRAREVQFGAIPVARDLLFFWASLAVLAASLRDGELSAGEGAGMVALFGAYVYMDRKLAAWYGEEVLEALEKHRHPIVITTMASSSSSSSSSLMMSNVAGSMFAPSSAQVAYGTFEDIFGTATATATSTVAAAPGPGPPSSPSPSPSSPAPAQPDTASSPSPSPSSCTRSCLARALAKADAASETCFTWVALLLYRPFIGDIVSRPEIVTRDKRGRAILLSLGFLMPLAGLAIALIEYLADVAGASHFTTTLTITSLGVQLPSAFALLDNARSGNISLMSHALSAPIFDILIGLGLPYFFFGLIAPVKTDIAYHSDGVNFTYMLVINTSLVFLGLCLRRWVWMCGLRAACLRPTWPSFTLEITVVDAWILICMYFIVIALIVTR